MKDRAANENDRVTCDNQDWKPGREFSVMLIACAPITNAQSNDAAEEKAFVCNRIEYYPERAALIITACDVAIESITNRGEKEDRDRCEALPILGITFLNALPVVDRERDE